MRRVAFIADLLVIALIALLLAPHTSYQPGALMAAHANLHGQCADCHQPWHGPANDRCVACHGDITDDNPHGGYDVTSDSGLIAGQKIFVTSDNDLACLSCHSEHRGAIVDLNTSATFGCKWCHQHPSLGAVDEHTVAVMKRGVTIRGAFTQPFNHFEHQLLITSHVPALPAGFKCDSCHVVSATLPLRPERMSLRWASCAGNSCHIAPQDSFMQLPAALGPSPLLIAYTPKFLHLNAVFAHSAGHLATPCESCHFAMATSTSLNGSSSKEVENCFKCHAHQTTPPAAADGRTQAAIGWLRKGSAYAAATRDEISSSVTACGQCHPFHIHGPMQQSDFPQPARDMLPNAKPHLTWTIYLPAFGGTHGVVLRPIYISPWLIGWLGLLAAALCVVGLVRMLPVPPAEHEVVAGVAPQRTREVPLIDDTFQTSVRHLYIIGEASGTASINLAMRSGRQVIEAIAAELKRTRLPLETGVYDVVIVGCGPAGLGATATARAAGLNYVTLEKMTPASTLRAYPRAKFVQATPIDIDEYGSFFLEGDNSREQLIEEWERIIATLGLKINDREDVVEIAREGDLLTAKTARGNAYKTRAVVLAIGVRGNARHLNLQGEEPGRVIYMLIEPDEFQNRRIMVVGGGNTGAEVAQALAAPALGNKVSYSFRAPVLTNITRENAEKISALQQAKLLTLYPATALKQIKPEAVVLEPLKNPDAESAAPQATFDSSIEVGNDLIFAMIGAELPTAFLKKIGVKLVSKGRPGPS